MLLLLLRALALLVLWLSCLGEAFVLSLFSLLFALFGLEMNEDGYCTNKWSCCILALNALVLKAFVCLDWDWRRSLFELSETSSECGVDLPASSSYERLFERPSLQELCEMRSFGSIGDTSLRSPLAEMSLVRFVGLGSVSSRSNDVSSALLNGFSAERLPSLLEKYFKGG